LEALFFLKSKLEVLLKAAGLSATIFWFKSISAAIPFIKEKKVLVGKVA
jgi:hypothetical protein